MAAELTTLLLSISGTSPFSFLPELESTFHPPLLFLPLPPALLPAPWTSMVEAIAPPATLTVKTKAAIAARLDAEQALVDAIPPEPLPDAGLPLLLPSARHRRALLCSSTCLHLPPPLCRPLLPLFACVPLALTKCRARRVQHHLRHALPRLLCLALSLTPFLTPFSSSTLSLFHSDGG